MAMLVDLIQQQTRERRRESMVDTELLEKAIQQSGLKKGYIAEQLGMTRATLRAKTYNETEFTASEIRDLCLLLSLNRESRDAIFFNTFGG